MASFSGSIDLMQCKGAQLLSGIDAKNPSRNYVCIPVEWSEIKVTEDAQRKTFHANMRVNIWSASDAFRQACIDRRMQRGDSMDGYNPPSHTMEVGYTQEFREKAMAAAKKRLLTEHPDWVQDENENKDLRNAMYNAVRVHLGSVYLNQPKLQTAYQGTATAAAGVSGYQPQQQEEQNMDDLPF